eukprot:6357823-Amphidinium_carterae.1
MTSPNKAANHLPTLFWPTVFGRYLPREQDLASFAPPGVRLCVSIHGMSTALSNSGDNISASNLSHHHHDDDDDDESMI